MIVFESIAFVRVVILMKFDKNRIFESMATRIGTIEYIISAVRWHIRIAKREQRKLNEMRFTLRDERLLLTKYRISNGFISKAIYMQ